MLFYYANVGELNKSASVKMDSADLRFIRNLVLGASCVIGGALAYKVYSESRKQKVPVQLEVEVKQIWIYPIKSCGGISADKLPTEGVGLITDRQYLIIRDDRKRIDGSYDWLSLRCTPKMASIHPEWTTPSSGGDGRDGVLSLTSPGIDRTVVVAREGQIRDAKTYDINVWMKWGVGEDCGDEVAEWLCEVLGQPHLRLARVQQQRVCDPPKYAKNSESIPEVKARWQDGYPLTVVSMGTVQHTADDCGISCDEVEQK